MHLRQTYPLAVLLFALWIILSGKLDVLHLLMGAVITLCITLGTYRLLLLPPAIGTETVHPAMVVPWSRLLTYIPWLCWEIVVASLQIAYLVLHPKMPISPCLVCFRMPLPHTLARLTLATSITLTPGTVTLDVQDDEFLVHALTTEGARGLDPSTAGKTMLHRVATLYTTAGCSQPTGIPT
ncbi:MAG TPA: Na+/H+ antiporter subunit E [Candidatus Tectomicrobia bacterium]